MNIDEYFLRPRDKMPPKEIRNQPKTTRLEATANAAMEEEEQQQQQLQATEEVVLDPAFRQTIQEITANITKVIDEKLGPLSQALQAHAQQLSKIEERTSEAEKRIAAAEHTCESVDTRVQKLEKQIQSMAEHIDDLENRGRRKNIRVIGLPEDAEGSSPTKFFESWIPDLLGLDTKAGRVKIERAHRTLAPKPGPNQRPRPVLIRFHNFADKQRVMDAARRCGTVKYKESTIMFFQDLSAAVLRKRKGFEEVKKSLRDIGAKYMMLYPATLKITHGGESRNFDSPSKAAAFVDTLR